MVLVGSTAMAERDTETRNKRAIHAAFDAWQNCAKPPMRPFGVAGTVLARVYFCNTPGEVRTFLQGIQKAKAVCSQSQT